MGSLTTTGALLALLVAPLIELPTVVSVTDALGAVFIAAFG